LQDLYLKYFLLNPFLKMKHVLEFYIIRLIFFYTNLKYLDLQMEDDLKLKQKELLQNSKYLLEFLNIFFRQSFKVLHNKGILKQFLAFIIIDTYYLIRNQQV